MKVFILSSSQERVSHHVIQQHLQDKGVGVWIDAASVSADEPYLETLLHWLNDSDLIIVLVSGAYLNSRTWITEWKAAMRCNRAKLIVRLEPVDLPKTPSDSTVLDCYDMRCLAQTVYEFIEKRKRMQVFVSYSRADSKTAKGLVAKLKKSLNRTWIDSSGLEHGEQFPSRILTEIGNCDCFVLLWSRHSRQSRWVEKEWNYAFKLGKKIIPVLLDKTVLPMSLEDTHAFASTEDDAFRSYFDIPQGQQAETKWTVMERIVKAWCRMTGQQEDALDEE